ncbi:LacI family transcriptional regulator [Cetobacterium somerae]|uniref:substrate-binding domain-containing protein n=1 Tax=Cetobacterium sp. NK01 TaxID=2993530 RepID=UPI00211670F3|nr:LacI family DNA-binding transcriptional regulator [Cetobacterium sp. NK01]MCQ8213089.1 LacI family transcriptional regulator [Cetobacterium sp. NK01]
MVTQAELAKILGITRTTVARALNGSKNIKIETKERVLKLADEMGYEKNYLGSSLAIKEKKVIVAIIVKSINEEYSKKLKSGLKDFQEEVKAYGIKIKTLETDINDSEGQLEILKKFLEKKIHGLIIIPLNREKIIKMLQPIKNDLKIVSIGKQLFEEDTYIDSKYEKSGRIAADVLSKIADKNKKILVIDAGDDLISSKIYLKGVLDKLKELDRKIEGPIQIKNLLENKKQILNYLSNDIDGVYINRYAPEIIEYLGEIKKDNYKFVTNGFNEKIRGLIKTDKVVATVSEDFYNQGYIAGKKIFESLYKTSLKRSHEYETKIDILFKESLD